MKIYVRKVFDHDVTHEVSVRTDIVKEFFDNNTTNLTFRGVKSNSIGSVGIFSATDPRFGGSFKSLLVDEGGISVNDIILITKHPNDYSLEIVRPYDSRFATYSSLFKNLERHETIFVDDAPSVDDDNSMPSLDEKAKGGFNKIYYGCPGCGKSYTVQKMLKDANVPVNDIFRVTFHPEYSNYDFVGQIMPTVETIINDDGKKIDIVKYKFTPGPFTLALKQAQETNTMVYLIIEEINRGNAAAIFGDLFQLLDRVSDVNSVNYSASEYPITNVAIQKELGLERVIIPSNLSIIATMNTSDQNVFTLDTAFKRRWEFEQIDNDFKSSDIIGNLYLPGCNIKWKDFVKKINSEIARQNISDSISDDKRIGKYFVSQDMLVDSYVPLKNSLGVIDYQMVEKAKRFAYKILEYIWNDVAKYEEKANWFDMKNVLTLEQLINAFIDTNVNNPLAVFVNNIF